MGLESLRRKEVPLSSFHIKYIRIYNIIIHSHYLGLRVGPKLNLGFYWCGISFVDLSILSDTYFYRHGRVSLSLCLSLGKGITLREQKRTKNNQPTVKHITQSKIFCCGCPHKVWCMKNNCWRYWMVGLKTVKANNNFHP